MQSLSARLARVFALSLLAPAAWWAGAVALPERVPTPSPEATGVAWLASFVAVSQLENRRYRGERIVLERWSDGSTGTREQPPGAEDPADEASKLVAKPDTNSMPSLSVALTLIGTIVSVVGKAPQASPASQMNRSLSRSLPAMIRYSPGFTFSKRKR